MKKGRIVVHDEVLARVGVAGKAGKLPAIRTGDRVRTPNGVGVVVEVKGKECLVQLENRRARVWQRRSALAAVPGAGTSATAGNKGKRRR